MVFPAEIHLDADYGVPRCIQRELRGNRPPQQHRQLAALGLPFRDADQDQHESGEGKTISDNECTCQPEDDPCPIGACECCWVCNADPGCFSAWYASSEAKAFNELVALTEALGLDDSRPEA